jgi:type II secretory pathway component PulF
LIDGGVPLYDAVMLIYNTSDNYALKDICYTIAHLLNNGKNFSYSLARNYEFFDEGDVMIVKS